MKATDYSSLRLDEDICQDMDREEEEKRLARRRWMTLASIASLFLISGTILTLSVVHDVRSRAKEPGWEEFSCPAGDPSCLELLCPEGMVWDMVTSMCMSMSGYTCCTACTHQYQCFNPAIHTTRCCHSEGVVPSAYKQVCREGFLWVQWKKKCLRKS